MSIPLFSLKRYQSQSLASLRRFLETTVQRGSAAMAFHEMTGRTFIEAPGMPGLPYICLRIPTGGGKTVMAAHSIAHAADCFLHTPAPTVLWLVPSQTIRDQTLASLQDRSHPNRRALAERFGENVRVMGVAEALYARRADYDGGATVIVATIQAFRVEEKEGRKVYETNGELMDHFSALPEGLLAALEKGPGGGPVFSLANVLRMRRPMVIVDEAHNARTALSFDTLAGLKPSLIVEFTATPLTPEEHDPDAGLYASNILHHVSAAELKAADMIKLPVILRGRPDPRETIADALAWLDEMVTTAKEEERETGEFIRPVMLVQAEPKSKLRKTLHTDVIRDMLKTDFNVPEAHIAVATGDSRELDGVNLFDPACPIRVIITQQALREGWDCSFAYVLCSVAEQKSGRAVEQLLGRVLRLPHASRKRREDLNRAYAFATTTAFQNAAMALQDGLVANGFEAVEAKALVKVPDAMFDGMEEGGAAFVFEEPLPAGVDAALFKANVEGALGGRVEVDLGRGVIRTRGALSNYDRTALLLAMPEEANGAVEALVHKSRGGRLRPAEDAPAVTVFAVPRLAVRRGNTLELFDRAHFLDIPWPLEACDAAAILRHYAPARQAGEEALIDISASGSVTVDFVDSLHAQLALALEERGWSKSALVNWLDRRLPISTRRDVTRYSSTAYIGAALEKITERAGLAVDRLARDKFRLLDALGRTIAELRAAREEGAFQQALLPMSGLAFETSADVALTFTDRGYSYNRAYKGKTTFHKHLSRVVGDLEESGEEFDCAVHIERMSQVKAWLRNTVRQPNSFWLQTATDKFYPDFLALLEDGRYLAVEYKGAHLASSRDAEEKRLVGELWAERSAGRCVFVMVEGTAFQMIDNAL